ncbi:MAG: S8 family serine peptidase [Lachnospira eligens]
MEADNNGENPYSYVAQRDTSGHGTLLASISAGSYTDGYVGVAPGAELLVVKLKQSKQYLRDFF